MALTSTETWLIVLLRQFWRLFAARPALSCGMVSLSNEVDRGLELKNVVSAAKLASNRKNSLKSCGPRTDAGKQASRFNALKHGLTATLAMLPDEDPAAYEARRDGWLATLRPRNDVEVDRVERAVYLSWQLERVERAQSAQLCYRVETATVEKRQSEMQETIELSLRLFQPSGEFRWGGSETSTPAAKPGGTLEAADLDFHPALVGSRLEKLADGCRWMLSQWNELGEALDQGRAWEPAGCFKAIRLLGMHPVSVVDLPDLAHFLRMCDALSGAATDLTGETWGLIAPAGSERGLEKLRLIRESEGERVDDESARGYLRTIVEAEVERLQEKVDGLDRSNELEAELAPHLLAFDTSDDGERIRRYEVGCRRFVMRILDDLARRPAAGASGYAPSYAGGYRSLLRSGLGLGPRESGGATGASELIDAGDAVHDGGMTALSPTSAVSCTEAPARAIERKRNEANGDGGAERGPASRAEAPRRNEAKPPQRNEAKPLQRNEANGVAEADPTGETAIDAAAGPAESSVVPGEGVRRHQVGCVTVTRLSTAVGLPGPRTPSRRQRRAQRRELARRGSAE